MDEPQTNRRYVLKNGAASVIGIAALSAAKGKGTASAQSTSVTVDDENSEDDYPVEVKTTVSSDPVEIDEPTSITLQAEEAVSLLQVTGDTNGWTVEGMDPQPSIIGNPIEFPHESEDEDWVYGESDLETLTIALSTTVEEAEYSFTAQAENLDGELIGETSFTIEVVAEIEESPVEDTSREQYDVTLPEEEETTLSDIRSNVSEWANNPDDQIDDVDITLKELRNLIEWWANQ